MVVRISSNPSVTIDPTTIPDDPGAAQAGNWALVVEAWSALRGFPRAVEFHEGRLFKGGTLTQPTTLWGSRSDDYEDMGPGALADDAIQYKIASREVNFILWLLSADALIAGTSGGVFSLAGGSRDEPLGGDIIPSVRMQHVVGSMDMVPLSILNEFIFVEKSGKKIYANGYTADADRIMPIDLTILSEHIAGSGIAQDKLAHQNQPNSVVYMVRKDGQLLALTYDKLQEIVAFSRIITDGEFESVEVVPHPDGDRVQVLAVVKRTINGQTKRYVEYFEDGAPEFSARAWDELYTDCAKVYDGAATTNITGLSHLEAKMVDVVADGSYKGQKLVSAGAITLLEAASKVEVGLHFTPKVVTMRPAFPNEMIEGLPRRWAKIFLRLIGSIGAKVNGEEMQFAVGGQQMDAAPPLFTGDKPVQAIGWSMEGYITVEQNQPYPLTILS